MKKITLFLILVMGFSLLNAQGYKNRVKSKTNKTKLVKKIVTYEDFQNATSKPQSGFTEYVTSVGDTIKLGSKIKLGTPSRGGNSFLYVWVGGDFNGWTYAHISAQEWESEVVKLRVLGSKKQGYSIGVTIKHQIGMNRYLIAYEKALSAGEVQDNVVSRDEAIAKLKEAKELLDIEMMTREEYDALKEELTPIIRNN